MGNSEPLSHEEAIEKLKELDNFLEDLLGDWYPHKAPADECVGGITQKHLMEAWRLLHGVDKSHLLRGNTFYGN